MTRHLVLLFAALATLACSSKPWSPKNYTSNEELYKASLQRLQRGKLDDAIAGFEELTLDLPARDTLLSRAQWYLGQAHEKKGEHILAAQSYSHLMESFPDDTLADDALLLAGKSYRKLWRKSSLDATYGESALNTFNTLLALYPNSELRGEAEKNIRELETQFAKKDYDTGVRYLRRKAFDSAIIYFKDVVKKYPQTDYARQAQLRLVDAYGEINYRADRDDTCAALRENYPSDREVRTRCGAAPVAASASPAPAPTVPAPTTPTSP